MKQNVIYVIVIKCKPAVDSHTRQEVKADEHKNKSVTEQVNEYANTYSGVCLT